MEPGKWAPGKDHDSCKAPATTKPAVPTSVHSHSSGASVLSPWVSALFALTGLLSLIFKL